MNYFFILKKNILILVWIIISLFGNVAFKKVSPTLP